MAKTRMTFVFNTKQACKYHLNYQDMAILDWIYTFAFSGKMTSKNIWSKGTKTFTRYYWLYYQALIDDFYDEDYSFTPLGITNRQVLARHIKSLCQKGLLGFSKESTLTNGSTQKGCYTMISINHSAFLELTGTGDDELRAANFFDKDGNLMSVKDYKAMVRKNRQKQQEEKQHKKLYSKPALKDRECNRAKVEGHYGFKEATAEKSTDRFLRAYNTRQIRDFFNQKPSSQDPVDQKVRTNINTLNNKLYFSENEIQEAKEKDQLEEEASEENKTKAEPSEMTRWLREYLVAKNIGLEASLIKEGALIDIVNKAEDFGFKDKETLKAYIDKTIRDKQRSNGRLCSGWYILKCIKDKENIRKYKEDAEGSKFFVIHGPDITCPVCSTVHGEYDECPECGFHIAEGEEEACFKRVLYNTDKSLLKRYLEKGHEIIDLKKEGCTLEEHIAKYEENRLKFLPEGDNEYRRLYMKQRIDRMKAF